MTLRGFEIDGRQVGPEHPPYIIAEISGNHNGQIQRALELIDIAAEAGADAVKLQTFTADSLTLDTDREEFVLKGGTWDGYKLYRLYEESHTPWDWHPLLFERAKRAGITIFSSPFDLKAVALLRELGAPAYKVASNEFNDWPLIAEIARAGKPVIMSTGVASRSDVEETVGFARECGIRDIALLHCVSAYPALPEDAHIRTIDDIAGRFPDVVTGFSDHTLGVTASIAAVARGACVIEKHFTLRRADGGPDSSFSLEPDELRSLCKEVRFAWKSLGSVRYGGESDLKGNNIFTRQYWTIKDIRAGEEFSLENVKSIRAPSDAGGLSTKQFRELLGKSAARNITQHEPVRETDIEKG